jgi:hypothetical protein
MDGRQTLFVKSISTADKFMAIMISSVLLVGAIVNIRIIVVVDLEK